MKKIFIISLLTSFLVFPCLSHSHFNKSYGKTHYSYNVETGSVKESSQPTQEAYKIGLIIDTPISNPPTTGFLYKVLFLSKAMIKKGHSYVFFICNRTFYTKEELSNFEIEGIKVHLLDEKLFYNKLYMSKLIQEEKIEILQYELAQTFLTLGNPIKNLINIPSVLTLHDVEEELMDVLGKSENKNIVDFTHYVAGHLADSLITLTNIEKEKRINKHGIPRDKIFITSIGVDDSIPYRGSNLNEKIIGFIGNQFYEPNRRATLYLIEKVLPLVKKKDPDAVVKIIGMCPEELKELYKNRKDVILTEEIKNHDQYIKEATSFTVGTCCTDVGSGMNVKVSNYCALGLPIVLTPICYKGYENIKSLQVVSLDPMKIAEEINKIFHNKNYAKKLGTMNHELVFKHLSWDKIAQNLENALHYAISHKEGSRSSKVEIKPIWMLEKRHDDNMLKGHYIVEPRRFPAEVHIPGLRCR